MGRPAGEVTFQQLRYLVALVDHGHFGRAAASCRVSQPTLSTQLRRLEERLGASLVDRAASPPSATPLGARVAALARGLLLGREELIGTARQEAEALRGPIRLGVIPTLAPYLLPALAPQVRQRWPEVTMEVVERPTHDLTELLRQGALDVALVATREHDPSWSGRVLGYEPFVCYLAPAHPLLRFDTVDAAALPHDELWLLRDGHCFRDQVLAACGADGAGMVGGVRIESGALGTLGRMVDTAGGLTLLPRMAVAAMGPDERARVRPFAPPRPGRTLRALVRRAYAKRAVVEAFIGAAAETIARYEKAD
ncbi:MAG: LysR substrate-binding domain-containing protein [Trueperaceae bacterium]|nr:LysR substrate-binding domain-containing protein [Trueperaceae bacterium]